MISGRGLGHTGGTLDKLDSIPGYATQPDIALFRARGRERPAAPSSARPADLAPADQRLYAIRDVTATVESIPLITASILSKKLAAGLQALVLDVKTGTGAFMPTLEGSRELAESIVAVANGAGLPTIALITDMNEPLASAAGNAVEVLNAVDYLTGASGATRGSSRSDARARRGAARARGARADRSRPAEAALVARARERRRGGALRAHGRRARRPGRLLRRAHALLPRRAGASTRRAGEPGFVEAIDARALASRSWNWAAGGREPRTRSIPPSA